MRKSSNLVVIEKPEEDESSDWELPVSFNCTRHHEAVEKLETLTHKWRMKERMKTVSVALVLCLNVGVDPPDIVKTQPCARLECWIDPMSTPPSKALESIGTNLQRQYERWQPRARYKQSLDPTVEEVKKLCTSLRKNAKEERVLFHYNGHGVPRPTVNGEIWVFNKTYTQYIPLSIYDLQAWMGSPSIYVYDCSNAGVIVDLFKQYAVQHEEEFQSIKLNQRASSNVSHAFNGSSAPCFTNCIQLAACSNKQILPMNPNLPADLFTSCLTTPIKVALRWFVMHQAGKLVADVTLEIIDQIPGMLNDRRTMLGELNWIFTAITDTIAWNTLPKDLFQKLFRQDLLVASLFRNFLLGERIMRTYNCTPISSPRLPPTYQHPMWQAWDLALDVCLSQLNSILNNNAEFKHSPFFEEQLTAFEVWLSFGAENRMPPEQLPIVLQVLLSQVHRLKALDLLGRFLDLGPWAVNLALSVGIFPYVLKLLQSSARELQPLLVFIWAKILAVDNTCQADLVRDDGHKYFLSVLSDQNMESKYRTMATFVMVCIVNDYQSGQEAALQGSLISLCLEQLNDPNPLFRQWLAICLGKTWTNYDAARWCGVRDSAHEKLYTLLSDDVPEVRAAAVYALGTFVNSVMERTDHANMIDHSIGMKLINTVSQDGSPIVRKELVIALHWFVLLFENQFLAHAFKVMENERFFKESMSPSSNQGNGAIPVPYSAASSGQVFSGSLENSSETNHLFIEKDKMRKVSSSSSLTSLVSSGGIGNIYTNIWKVIFTLAMDAIPDIADAAKIIINHIRDKAIMNIQAKEIAARNASSHSAPSSPSNRSSYLAESPPRIMMVNSSPKDNAINSRNGIPPLPTMAPTMSWTSAQKTFQQYQHSAQFTMTRKLFDKGPEVRPIPEENDDEIRPRKALVKSAFVNWCSKYFAQSIMNRSSEKDPESTTHNLREWLYIRNSAYRKRANEEIQIPGAGKLDDQVFINKNPGVPAAVKLHPYDTHFAVADKDSYLSIWDWDQGARKSYYSNRNPKGALITYLDFINAHDNSLLMVGSDDGAIRLWRDYIPSEHSSPVLVTAWQALSDMIPCTRGSGLIGVWEQRNECLVASGDVRVIRLWDMNKEMKIQDLPTGAGSCVTTMSSDPYDSALVVVGCGDGSVRLYDRRLPANECRVMTMREHVGWVVNIHMQMNQTSRAKMISGSVGGEIKFWEPRYPSSVHTYPTSMGMTAMSVHPSADLIACGSVNQYIGIYTSRAESIGLIKYHDGFMGQRIGPISCIDFHKYKVNLIAGSTDSFISLFSSEVCRR